MWMVERVQYIVCNMRCFAVIHIVREIIEEEKIRQKVVANPQLVKVGVRIGHRC